MKRNTFLTLITLLLLWACDETNTTIHTLSQDDFDEEITDSLVMYVESPGTQIELKGNLKLIEGECTVSLKSPLEDTLFSFQTSYVYDTIFSIDSIYLTNTVLSIDSIFMADTLFAIDTTFLPDTIFSVDSTFITDSIFTTDTILYNFVYKESFTATNTFKIDEKFDRILGKWIFTYKIEAIDDIDPEGSFEFVVKYND